MPQQHQLPNPLWLFFQPQFVAVGIIADLVMTQHKIVCSRIFKFCTPPLQPASYCNLGIILWDVGRINQIFRSPKGFSSLLLIQGRNSGSLSTPPACNDDLLVAE